MDRTRSGHRVISLSRVRPLDSYLVLQRTAHTHCRFKAQACFDDHTPRPATRRPHLGCARPSDDKQIMLSILRDHVPSLRVLLKTPLHGSCSLSIVERCANTCTADTVRGPALRGRRAYPATRDAGERPRCTPQPPLCMFRRRMVPCSNSLTCLESAQPCSGTTRHQRKL